MTPYIPFCMPHLPSYDARNMAKAVRGAFVLLAICCMDVLDARTVSFDENGRLISVVYASDRRIDYVYDASGNLIEERVNGARDVLIATQVSPANSGNVAVNLVRPRYVTAQTVTLTAKPSAGYAFGSWSGVAGCTTNPVCSFTVGANATDITAIANFTVSTTPTCTGITGPQSIPAAANSQTYTATCSNTSNYVWSLDDVTIPSLVSIELLRSRQQATRPLLLA
jgi:YD repeat-containing protein